MSEQSSLEAAINAVIRERGDEAPDQVDHDESAAVVDFVFNPPQPPSAEEIADGSASRG